MAIERWVLGGLELTSGSFTLMELVADPPRERRDWISAADSEAAALFRQPKHENRTITMKLRVTSQSSMDVALDQVGALVDKLRSSSASSSGVSLVWTPTGSTRPCTFTVLAGEITGLPIALGGEGYSWLLSRPIVTVELTCHPYWVGTETLTSTTISSTPLVTQEISGVTGDVPALGRLIVTDTATQSRRHVEWGLEGPLTYNASTSLLLDSDSLVTSGFSGSLVTLTGGYDPNGTGTNAIGGLTYTSPQALFGTGNLSHVGSFRVKARMMTNVTGSQVRLSWQVAGGSFAANAWQPMPITTAAFNTWGEIDLGMVTIPAVLSGTQAWSARVEAYTPNGGEVYADYLVLVPVGDGYGKARAAYSYSPGVVVANDAFVGTTAGSALNGRSAPTGGTWATSGDATDFVFNDNFVQSPADAVESLARSTNVVETVGRYAILGSTSYTDVQVDARVRSVGSGIEQSLVVRWTDSSNHLRLVAPDQLLPPGGSVRVEQVVGGTVTVLASTTQVRLYNTVYRLRLIAFTSGRAIGLVLSDGGAVLATMDVASSALAPGGTLQTGKPGIKDRCLSTGAVPRYLTAFAVSTPAAEPIALYSGKNMQVRYDDVIRQDSTGTYTGRPPSYRGSRFLVPVGTSRVLVKARRNDIETTADGSVTDSTQVQVGWTPRGLAVPR